MSERIFVIFILNREFHWLIIIIIIIIIIIKHSQKQQKSKSSIGTNLCIMTLYRVKIGQRECGELTAA